VYLILFFGRKVARKNYGVSNFLVYLGKRTYGMYLYHWAVLRTMERFSVQYSDQKGFSFSGILIALLVTILVSLVSFSYLEMPFLRIKSKFD